MKKIDSENCRKSFKRIMKWSMNYIILTQQRKKPGTSNIRTRLISSKLLSFYKSKRDYEARLKKCTTSKRTTSNHLSFNSKKNIIIFSLRSNSNSLSRKEDIKDLTSNATLETKSSLLKDKAQPSSLKTNKSLQSTTEESQKSRNEKQLPQI